MSNYLNFSVTSEEDIMNWILMKQGHPLIEVEITEDQLRMCINDSIEEFTKYAIQEEEYLALDLEEYNTSGYTLPNNVMDIFTLEESSMGGGSSTGGMNTLFSVQNTMLNNGAFPAPGSGAGGSWIDYHLSMSYLELVKTMTASKFYYDYNERDQLLKLIPNPSDKEMKGFIVIGCNVIRADDKQMGEGWVKKYANALAKELIGNVRSKFEGTPLPGGGTVNSSIKDEGISEQADLLEKLQAHYVFVDFFVG